MQYVQRWPNLHHKTPCRWTVRDRKHHQDVIPCPPAVSTQPSAGPTPRAGTELHPNTKTRVRMWLEEGVQRRLHMCGPTHPSTCLGAQATKFN